MGLLGRVEVEVLALGDGIDAVLLGAGIHDQAGPVQAESEIVGVAGSVHVALHVADGVLVLGVYGVHGGGHLEGQQSIGLSLAGDDLPHSVRVEPDAAADLAAVLAEVVEDRVGEGLNLGHDHGCASCDDRDDGAADCGLHIRRLVLEHQHTACAITSHSLDGPGSLQILVPAAAYPYYRDGYGCEENRWTPWLGQIVSY